MSHDRHTITLDDLRHAARVLEMSSRRATEDPPVMPLYEHEVPRFAEDFRRMGYRVQVIPRKVGDEGYTLEPLYATGEPIPRVANN